MRRDGLLIILNAIMLLQLEHQHPASSQAVSPKLESPKSSKVQRKGQPKQEQLQSVFFNPPIIHQTSSFNFHTDGLEEVLKDLVLDLPLHVINAIAERKVFSEQRVYQAIAHTSNDFVGIHLRDFSYGLKHELQNMFETIHNAVEAGIWDGRYEIDESKNKYFSLARKEDQRLTYITGELVKKNLQSFRGELEEEGSGLLEVSVSQRQAKSENYKAKKAETFIRSIQQEQKRHREMLAKQTENRRQYEAKLLQENQLREQQRKRQKQQMVRKRFEKQAELVGLQKEHRQKIHSEYLDMVSNYKQPLHEKKDELSKKQALEEQKKKFQILQEIREQRRSIPFEEIQEHMERYQQLKDEHEQFRDQQKELRDHQSEIIRHKKYYRSKFYSLSVTDRTSKPDSKEMLTSLVQKKVDYADHVKHNFMPKTDERKQQELQQLIRKMDNHKKNVYHSRKYMDEGNRNLEKLHMLIGQLRAKNKLKPNVQLSAIVQTAPAPKYKNYLSEVKQSRINNGQKDTIDYEQAVLSKDDGWVRMEAQRKEEQARKKEQYLNSAMESMDIHSHMQGKSMVEQNYIQSVKAKMALLKKYSQTIDNQP